MTGELIQMRSAVRVAARRLLPGLIAGLVFAMWAMVVGIFTSNLWAPPQGIAQSVGIGAQGHNFQLVPFVLGLVGHMMNSIVIASLLIAIARAVHRQGVGRMKGGIERGRITYVVI